MTDADDRPLVRGVVKWFDPGKGFGFVVADDGGPDILLHANVLRAYGQGSIADGSVVEMTTQRTERGVQAVVLLGVEPPDVVPGIALTDFAEIDPGYLAELPVEPARVKWFDKGKGFGFANVFGSDDDIFVHIEVLRRSGFADLQPGEAVGLRVIAGKRGRMASEVLPWDFVLRQRPERR